MYNKHFVGNRVSSFEQYDEIGPITGIALLLDDENEIVAGDDTGYMLEVSCPYGTKEMADDLLAKLQDKTYKGFSAENAVLSPTAELGDGVTVNGIYSVLAHRNVTFGPGHMSGISAPGEGTLEHEYSWVNPEKKEFDRRLRNAYSLISKTAEEIKLEVYSLEVSTGENISSLKTELESGLSDLDKSFAEALEGLDGEFTKKLESYSTIEQTSSSITAAVSESKEYTNTSVGALDSAVSLKLESYSTIEQTASSITTAISESKEYTNASVGDLDSAVSLKLESYSTIEQTSSSITAAVSESKEYTDGEVKSVTTKYATLEQTVNGFRLEVSNGETSSTIKLMSGETEINSQNITLSGVVTFSALSNAPGTGQTKINGGWIDADTLTVNAAKVTGTLSIGTMPDGVARTGDIPTKVGDLTNDKGYQTASGVTSIVGGVVTTDYVNALGISVDAADITGKLTADQIDADSIVASGLQGTYIGLTDWDDDELGYIELNYYDRQDTVNLHSNEVLWLSADEEAILMCGLLTENIAINSGGIYASSAVVETSDRRKKKDITYGLESLDGFFDDLKPADYRFVNGKSGRRHRGFVAQDIKDNLDKHGISTQDFAGYVERTDRDGETFAGLRYSEFIALLVEQVQKLKSRVAELEGKQHGPKA